MWGWLVVYTRHCEVCVAPTPHPTLQLSTTSHLSFSLLLSLPPFPELANQIQYSIMQDLQQGESWENGKMPHSRLLLNYQLRQI